MYLRKAVFLRIFFCERSEQAAAKKCPGPGVASSELWVGSRESRVGVYLRKAAFFKNLKGERSEQAAATKWPGPGVGGRGFARICARLPREQAAAKKWPGSGVASSELRVGSRGSRVRAYLRKAVFLRI